MSIRVYASMVVQVENNKIIGFLFFKDEFYSKTQRSHQIPIEEVIKQMKRSLDPGQKLYGKIFLVDSNVVKRFA